MWCTQYFNRTDGKNFLCISDPSHEDIVLLHMGKPYILRKNHHQKSYLFSEYPKGDLSLGPKRQYSLYKCLWPLSHHGYWKTCHLQFSNGPACLNKLTVKQQIIRGFAEIKSRIWPCSSVYCKREIKKIKKDATWMMPKFKNYPDLEWSLFFFLGWDSPCSNLFLFERKVLFKN